MNAGLQLWHTREQPDRFPDARDRLVSFLVTELLPHLERDERWLIEAKSCPEGRLLAAAMRAEVRVMTAAVYDLSVATTVDDATAQTRLLHTFLAAHDHHEQLLRTADSAA